MTMTVEIMRLFNQSRAAIDEAEKEKLLVQKRLDQFSQRVKEIKAMEKERLDQLGISYDDLEKRIKKGNLNKDGIQMMMDQMPPGQKKMVSELLGNVPEQGAPKPAAADEDREAPENRPRKKKKRMKFNI